MVGNDIVLCCRCSKCKFSLCTSWGHMCKWRSTAYIRYSAL